MNNTIKKIVSVAMAFTLLGTGTAVVKTIAPQSDNTITADAACNHNMPRPTYGPWVKVEDLYGWWYKARREVKWCCNSCGKLLYTTYEETIMKYGDDIGVV